MNSNGKKFGLWVALAHKGGNLIPLPELPVSTGMAHINENNAISVYPNPFSNIINVERLDNGSANLSIQDVTGKVVREASNVSNMSFDMSNMPSGVYFLRSTERDGSTSPYKLVK
jgi:hypothetical protein